jgi:hypothetical protein
MQGSFDWRKVLTEVIRVIVAAAMAAGGLCACGGCLSHGKATDVEWHNEVRRSAEAEADTRVRPQVKEAAAVDVSPEPESVPRPPQPVLGVTAVRRE